MSETFSRFDVRFAGSREGPGRLARWRSGPDPSSTEAEAARILVAEDDDDMRAMLCGALSGRGYEVHEVADGRRFMKFMTGVSEGLRPVPDLIISDIRMPGTSGLRVLESIRRVDWATPVILLTAFGDRPTHAEARRLGAVALLDKPFELDDLVELVMRQVPPTI